MLCLPLVDAKPGMRLALAVHHPYRPSSQLLAPGCVLQASIIGRLETLRISEIWVDCPQLDSLNRYISPALVRAREDLCAAACRLFEHVLAKQAPEDPVGLNAILGELLAIYRNDRQAALFLPCLSRGADLLVQHSMDTAILALLLALRLEAHISQQRRDAGLSSEHFVEHIALGALLHDVGLYMVKGGPLPPEMRRHDEPQDDDVQHVELGYRAVKPHVDSNAAPIVLHHHQHLDGSGYPMKDNGALGPSGLEGTRIPIYVRVATLADVFDELRIGGDGPPLPPGVALAETLSEPRLPWFDPAVAVALSEVVLPMPPGSTVRLNNGVEGVIVDIDHEEPERPVVQVITPGALLDPTVPCPLYDLRRRPDLWVQSLDGVELPQPPLAQAS
ncbi:MAG: HD-GYP domain-containing protein [Phycisphaerales bacterium JB038]